MMRIPVSIFAVFLFLVPLSGYADNDQDMARRALAEGRVKPLQDILTILDKKIPGHRIIKVKFEHDDGQYIYELKIIDTAGIVHEVEIDARTGRILEIEVDD